MEKAIRPILHSAGWFSIPHYYFCIFNGMIENFPKEMEIDIQSFPFSEDFFKREISWAQKGGLIGYDIDTLLIGKLNSEKVVYALCNCSSSPRQILYVETKLKYRRLGFAKLIIECFLKIYAKGLDVEASPPTSSGARQLLEKFGSVPARGGTWWTLHKTE